MKRKVSGLIFDLDGVLVFTDKFHYLAWKQIADEKGIPFDEKINDRLRGVSRMQSLEIILEKYSGEPLTEEQKADMAERKNEIYKSNLHTMTPNDVSEEVRKTLEELKGKGYKLAVGSSSKNAGFILEQVALRDAFDVLSDGNLITHSKPDPEVFLKAASLMGCIPEECAVIEDAEAGIDAAKDGGMIAVAIGNATSYGRSDIRLNTFSDLLLYF